MKTKKTIRHDRSIISSGIIALTFSAASQTVFAHCEPASYSVGSNGIVASGGGSFSRQACQEMNGGRGRIEYRFEHGHSVLIADRIPSIHFVDTPSAPLFNKTSGLNIKTAAAASTNVSGWFETRPDQSGKVGYYLNDITYNNYSDFTVNFTFKENWGQISRTGIKSPDGLPIYRINSQPWLGVSFQMAARVDGGNMGRWQPNLSTQLRIRSSSSTGAAFYLRAKLHQLDNPKSTSLPKEISLGEIVPTQRSYIKNFTVQQTNRFPFTYQLTDNSRVEVKLKLPRSIGNQCTPSQPTGGFPMVAPAPLGNMVAEVQTYPEKSSSRINLYSIDDAGRRAGTLPQPSFQNRKVMIRLAQGADGVVFTKQSSGRSNSEFDISNTRHDDEWQDLLLRWTDRRDNDDSYFNGKNAPEYSQSYRIRQNDDRNLGDIINSPIAGIGDFMATAANDGMVHIFKRDANNASYDLKLSYIPGTIARKDDRNNDTTLAKTLRHFANKNYTNNLYGVDGGFVLRKAKVGNTDHVFMFGAMGQGGKGAYALDLAGLNLGFTVGMPQIGKVRDGKYAGFLANGYGGNKTALYVYDMLGKNLLRKIDVPNGVGGLSSPTLVDTDFDGTVDIAYAGDRGGNIYRFDLRDSVANNWKVLRIYNGNANKPVTSAPAISRLASNKYVVIFGTGSDLNEHDVKDQTPQSIYGIFDDLPENMIAPETRATATEGELVKQTIEKKGIKLFLSNNETKGRRGWKIDLGNGDRVTIKPEMVLRTAFVTIRNYTSFGVCAAGTTVLGIDSETGGKLTKRNARPFIKSSNPPSSTNTNEPPLGCEKGTVSNQKGENYICPNGFVYSKLLTISYRDGKKKDESPFTPDGDAGGNGSGDEDGPANKNPNNTCFKEKSEDGSRTFLMSDIGNLDVTGPVCGGKLKRISWREIFF